MEALLKDPSLSEEAKASLQARIDMTENVKTFDDLRQLVLYQDMKVRAMVRLDMEDRENRPVRLYQE